MGLPFFSSGTPTFCQMGVLNSCFQNPSESSGDYNVSHFEIDLDDTVSEELSGCKTCQKEEVKVCNIEIIMCPTLR